MLVIFTSYVIGKLISVWNYFRELGNYVKVTQTQIKGIKSFLQRNSEYILSPKDFDMNSVAASKDCEYSLH